MRPVIHSKKHYVQKSLATIVGSAILNQFIVKSVPVDSATADEVKEGALVKACYLEFWLRTGETAAGTYVGILYKKEADGSFPSVTDMAALHDWDNKKNILWTGMGLINDQDADATPILRGWYKIPKGKQRFGLGDDLLLSIFAQGTIDLHVCGFATYKEYT